MNEQNKKQTWVRVETEDGTLGVPMELLSEIQDERRPVQQSEDQKKRVVSRLMSKLMAEA